MAAPPTVSRGRPLSGRPALARIAIVVALLGLEFAIRASVEEPGPLFLVPVVAAAYWFGRWSGVATGAAASILFVAATALNSPPGDFALLASWIVRVAIYCGTGYAVGLLVEQRRALDVEVAVREQELTELHAIQEALSPAGPPPRPGLAVAVQYRPAREGAAGDFYLVTAGPSPETTIIVLGDVAGKGVEAARRAAFVRTALATSAPFMDDPCRLLERANYSLVERAGESSVFVTAVCLVIRPAEQVVRWASAGHLPPIALDTGSIGEPRHRNLPLGIRADYECSAEETPFSFDAGFVAFTDGLTEARRRNDRKLYGPERVAAVVHALEGAPADEIVNRLASEAERFSGGSLTDDLCILAVRRDVHATRAR